MKKCILLLSFVLSSIVLNAQSSPDLSDEIYHQFFPSTVWDFPYDLTIVPTNEKDKKTQDDMYDFYNQLRAHGQYVLTDKEALQKDLSNVNIRTWGSLEGNLWIKYFMEQSKNLPFKITSNSVTVNDTTYQGSNYTINFLWTNPKNPKRTVFIEVFQTYVLPVKSYRLPHSFVIGTKDSAVFKAYYHKEANKWSFKSYPDSALISKNPLQRIGKTNYYQYPSLEMVNDCVLENKLNEKAINIDDTKSSSQNIKDLAFLETIAKENKLVCLGESHYGSKVVYFRDKVLFALNTYDYYPVIILEAPYSKTAFIDYYVHLKDDKLAAKFKNEIIEILNNQEDWRLADEVRLWNKTHKNKPITIAFNDLEHQHYETFKNILLPYFVQLDSSFSLASYNVINKVQEVEKLLPLAKERKLVGKYPFLTADYIESIIKNLRNTCDRFGVDNTQSKSVRHQAMLRNLTDEHFLGNFFKTGKVLMHGGFAHFNTQKSSSNESEGYFFSQEYQYTKGKTYILNIKPLSFCLGEMKDKNLNDYVGQGEGYRNLVNNYQKAYKEENIKEGTPFFNYNSLNEIDKLVIKKAYQMPNTAFFIPTPISENTVQVLKDTSRDVYLKTVKWCIDDLKNINGVVYIPTTPIVRATQRKLTTK